jgi:Flp pilus assembly protein TadD
MKQRNQQNPDSWPRSRRMVGWALMVILVVSACHKPDSSAPQAAGVSGKPLATSPSVALSTSPSVLALAEKWGAGSNEQRETSQITALLTGLRSSTVLLDSTKPIGREALMGEQLAKQLMDAKTPLHLTGLEAGFLMADLMQALGIRGRLVTVYGHGGKTSLRRRTVGVRWDDGNPKEIRGIYSDGIGEKDVSGVITPEHRSAMLDGITALHWIETHRFDRALDQIGAALKRAPDDAALRFLRGKAAFLKGDAEAGLLDMEQAVNAQEDASGQHQLAIAYIEMERSFKAYRALRRAVTLDVKNVDAWIGLGFLTLERYQTTEKDQRTGIVKELDDIEKALIAIDPVHARLIDFRARRLLFDDQREEAKSLVTKAIETSEDPAVLRAFLAELAMQAGDAKTATSQLEKALESNPDESDLWLLLASLYGDQGESTKAISALEQAARSAPFDPQIHAELVRAYQTVGQTEKALKAGKELAARFPGRIEGAVVLIEQALFAEDYERVVVLVNKALQKHPQDVDLHQALFLAYFSLGRKVDAKQSIDRLVKIDPKSRITLAEMFMEMSMLEPALFLLEEQVGADPSQSENAMNLALLYRRLRQTKDELRIRALMIKHASDPKAAEALYEDVGRQLDALEKSLKTKPEDANAP